MAPSPQKKKTTPSKHASPVVTPLRKTSKHRLTTPTKEESSPHGRAKCQRCGTNIAKGQDRWGKDYGDGYRWWHTTECKDKYHHKYEKDPRGTAKCKKCNETIQKGTHRVSQEIYPIREGSFAYGHIHYHPTCLTQEELTKLKSKGLDLEQEPHETAQRGSNTPKRTHHNDQQQQQQQHLRHRLKKLRSLFAKQLGQPTMKIFSDNVMDAICQSMPKTKEELLNIHGMGPKKFQSFGDPILTVLQEDHHDKRKSKQTCITGFFTPRKATAVQEEVVQVMDSLSCEDIVQRKFEHAAKNGYVVIECD